MAPNQKLVQTWAPAEMGFSSKVTFTLSATGNGTKLDLLHEDVPDASIEMISQGWESHYLGKIQKMFTDS